MNVFQGNGTAWKFVEVGKVARTDKRITIDVAAVPNARYLLQPRIAQLIANYDFVCYLQRYHTSRLPKICTEILCADNGLPYAEVQRRFPEETRGYTPSGDFPVGGFGGGSICRTCESRSWTKDVFIPAPDCGGGGGGNEQPGCAATVVFSSPDGTTGLSQVFSADFQQPTPTLLSGDATASDVVFDISRTEGKVLFARSTPSGSGVFKMNTDGSSPEQIAGLSLSDDGFRWWGGRAVILAFHRVIGPGDRAAIFLFDPANSFFTSPLQATLPAAGETDLADYDPELGGKRLVFARRDTSGQTDLFLANDVFDAAQDPATNVTNTADANESLPVFAHDDRQLACRVQRGGEEDVMLFPVAADMTIGVGLEIDLDNALFEHISSIDFTPDNRCLILVVEATDVTAATPIQRSEIVIVRLDSGATTRVTTNAVEEHRAVAIPVP